jgi:hypothetical protein
MSKATRTEHNGAKNGGGYWGPRAEAKQISKKRRRLIQKRDIQRLFKFLSDRV